MGFKCGIVGLPNVGKSTLFNALTQTAAAAAANYPFCTIEPNVGEVPVPDVRLNTLAKIAKSAEVIPTRLTFVDIAGLVRGASKGEGLGNQFLAVIREVDAIAYVLRCFEDDDIIHVEGRVDPDRRCRDHRDRADARRSRQPGAPRADPRAESARPGQGGEAGARSRPARLRLAARGQAGAARANFRRGPGGLQRAQSPHLKAGALCLQRRRGIGRDRQRAVRPRRGAGEGGRRGLRDHLGQDRGRARRARRGRARRPISPSLASPSPASTG